jgi:hypothetical protein
VIESRANDFERPSPCLDEIDPRDAYHLQYLALRASILDQRVRAKQPDQKDEVAQRIRNARGFLAAQPEFAREFLTGKTVQEVAADADRLEQAEIPRLKAEYAALLNDNEALRRRFLQVPHT